MVFYRLSKFWAIIVSFIVLVSFLPTPRALASTYGSGAYDSCKYSQGCPAAGSGSSTGGIVTQNNQPPSQILLNDFSEYFLDSGKQLDLQANQIISFDITVGQTTERHSATIKEVGPDYAVITLASTPFDVKLFIGDTRQFDVNADSKNDIQITLVSVNSGKATLIFKNLGTASPSIAKTSPTTRQQSESAKSNPGIIIYAALVLTALVIFLVLFFKRRKKRRQNRTPPF